MKIIFYHRGACYTRGILILICFFPQKRSSPKCWIISYSRELALKVLSYKKSLDQLHYRRLVGLSQRVFDADWMISVF